MRREAASRGRRCPRLLGAACAVLVASSLGGSAVGEEDLADGRRMYRQGIRPSGEPLTAIVAGDVPILGTQFSCQSCHGRSGLGAAEGNWIVPAIVGEVLYAPTLQHVRPAYDRESLGRVLREGRNPAGQPLEPVMPRYRLSDEEVASLAAYLESLSLGPSPGVDEEVIRLATVVTDDVAPDVRDAVLAVLGRYVEEKNRQTRLESRRWSRGTQRGGTRPTLFREWRLDVWTLTGPSEEWPEQLEARYRAAPVFAFLGGVSAGSWGPIGRFCESHEIPSLLPITDLPDAEAGAFYTLYFSRGLESEAELIARHVEVDGIRSVRQISCGEAATRAAGALRERLSVKGIPVEDVAFGCDDTGPTSLPPAAASASSALVLWVGQEVLSRLDGSWPPGRVYFSSTLVDLDGDRPLPGAQGPAFLAHPFRPPGEPDPARMRFDLWARTRGIERRHPRLQAQAYFAAIAMNDAIAHIGRYLVRDYALDMLDHAQGLTVYVPLYPRPSLGPGQRFLAKGGYILPVRNGRPESDGAVFINP